jgi:sugar lactone lactonase YvrE
VADTANNRIEGWYQKAGGAPSYVFGIAGRGAGYVTRPYGLTFDAAGNAYVADTYDSRIEKLSPTAAYLDQFGYISSNSGFAAPASGNGQYDNPRDVAYDARTGTLWVADTGNDRVQQITTGGAWLATYTGFSSPSGVAVDDAGTVYVADAGNHRVQRFSAGSWSTVAGTAFDQPRDVAVDDATRDVYVSDFTTDDVKRLRGSTWTTVGAGFNNPAGLAVDGAHRFLYLADSGNDRVERLDLATGAWDAWGAYGYDAGSFVMPSGLAVAPGGDLIVADTFANRLQRFAFAFPAATFTLSANPSTLTVRRGSSGSSTITIGPSNGFGSAVTLAVTCPRNVSCSFSPNPATTSSTLTIKPARKALARTTTLDVTGTGGGVTQHTDVTLTVA